MSMTLLVEQVQKIEQALNEHAAGWRNSEALRIITSAIRDIQHQTDWMAVTCLDFLIHVELRISAFRQTRWACDSPGYCAVARCCTPDAS